MKRQQEEGVSLGECEGSLRVFEDLEYEVLSFFLSFSDFKTKISLSFYSCQVARLIALRYGSLATNVPFIFFLLVFIRIEYRLKGN